MPGDMCKTIGAEAITAGERKRPKTRETASNHFQALITDSHALQAKLLQAGVVEGHGTNPRIHVSTPVMRDETEVCEPGTALHDQRCDLSETAHKILWRKSITVAYEHFLPARSLCAAPRLAHL